MRKRLTELAVKRLRAKDGKPVRVFDQGLPGLVLSISVGGSKAFSAVHYVGGKPRYRSLGKWPVMTLQKAREDARRFLTDPKAALHRDDADTFKEIAESYMRREVKKKKLRTEPEMQRMLDKYIYPALGDSKIDEITRNDVTALIDDLEDNHGERQAERVRGLLGMITRWHEDRVENYRSPVRRGKKKSASNVRTRILDAAEIRAVWRASEKLTTYGALVRVALLTGQRREKLVTMKWDDVVDSVWTVQVDHPGEKGHIGKVRLPQQALDVIQAQPVLGENPYVFAAYASGVHRPFNSFSKSKRELDTLVTKRLPDIAPWVFHDLRRTARSLMPGAAVTEDIAERVLGHKQEGIIAVYNHYPYFEEKSDALEKLAAVISDIVGSPANSTVKKAIKNEARFAES